MEKINADNLLRSLTITKKRKSFLEMFGWILIGWLILELGDMSISITLGGESGPQLLYPQVAEMLI